MKQLLALFSLCIFCFCGGCRDEIAPGTVEVKRPPVTGVTTAEVLSTPVDAFYETSATVKAKTTTMVASKIMARITALHVKEGDTVTAGQLLLVLDDRDIIQKIQAARAAYEESVRALAAAKENRALADITYRRYENLYDEKALSQQELDQIATRKKVADQEYERLVQMVKRSKAGLAEAQVFGTYTQITAPVSGVVTKKNVDLGDMAAPGMPLLILEDPASFRLDAEVDEHLAGRLSAGGPVEILIPSLDEQVSGTIMEVVPAVDPRSRSFLVKIALPRQGLQSGLYAKARIPVGKKEVVLLPRNVVVEKGQLTGVYVVDQHNVVAYRLVKLGERYGDAVEILSGLKPHERVITTGLANAVDGGMLQGEAK